MSHLLTIAELQQNLEEIRKQHRLKRLRKFLKFFLIGFLLWRDSEKRVSELTARNKAILDGLLKRIMDLAQVEQRIGEFAEILTFLTQIEERTEALKKELGDAQNLILNLEDGLTRCREMIGSYAKRAIEQREHAIDRKVEGIVDRDTYLIYSDKQRCIEAMKSLEGDLNCCDRSDILDDEYVDERRKKLEKSRQTILDYNSDFVQRRKKDYSHLWYKGLLSLDDEQQTAVVTDDKHNLVVAAAGSGKTEVLITRIAYLIARKPDRVRPNRILAIAYQRKAVEEIERRLRERYNLGNVEVKTFHKLGKDILEESGKEFRRTDIIDQNKKHEIMQNIFKHKVKNEPEYYDLFLKFVKTLHDKEIMEGDKTKDDVLTYARERTYFSIDNTRVNSRAEKEILDFFLTNKLNEKATSVKYEPDIDGFRPDFYLPEYDIFIEHWALNKNGEVPEWFSQTTQEYRTAMDLKKKWFSGHGKLLVETFAYEYDEGNPERFIEILKTRMIAKLQAKYDRDFKFTLKSYEEIVDVAWQSYRTPVDDIVNFITTAKTYGLVPERIADRLRKDKWTRKQLAFGNLTLPIYFAYEEDLQEHGKIDFEDMINRAIAELEKSPNLRADVYDHILIDEYQDISAQRYKLIKKLMERNPRCRLFCVGDDWQSIMGFSGSNLNFFVNFEQYFENPAITKISTNYRSIKTIVDAGADLIKNNTSCQIQKPTMSNCRDVKPIKVLRSPHREEYEKNYHRQTAEDCLGRIITYLKNGYSPKDILVLSRCMRTRIGRGYRFLSIIRIFIEKAKENGIRLAYENVDAHKKIRLLTAHKSKGLEAKIVFILNATKGTYGFPCEIEDPSIYEPARENYPPQDQKEEERRLFYVAMTRAMEDLYIYTWEPAKSEFLEEIEEHTNEIRLSY